MDSSELILMLMRKAYEAGAEAHGYVCDPDEVTKAIDAILDEVLDKQQADFGNDS